VTALEPLLRRACELEPERFRAALDPEGDRDTQVLVGSEWLSLNWMFLPLAGAVVQAAVQEAIEARSGYWGIESPYESETTRYYRALVNIGTVGEDTMDSPAAALLSAYLTAAVEAAKETA
jgi:hypothetical protein